MRGSLTAPDRKCSKKAQREKTLKVPMGGTVTAIAGPLSSSHSAGELAARRIGRIKEQGVSRGIDSAGQSIH